MGGLEGGDCSERICPFELAWVDGPNRDGVKHKYAECANKGTCDRNTGECICFPGYEGKGCGRQSCPAFCNGHGTCEYMKDMKFGKTYNEYYDGSSLEYSGLGYGGVAIEDHEWDSDRARACVCDPGWTGIACEKRMCPWGQDPMDVIPVGYGSEVDQVQTITLYDAYDLNSNFAGQTFALRFTSLLNETFVTQPIMWEYPDSVLEGYIQDVLIRLPNKVVDEVAVTVDSTVDANGVVINITFSGNAVGGKQHQIEVLAKPCQDGCTPKITGLMNLRTFHSTTLSTVQVTTTGSHEAYECSRRGKCVEGICSCYEGFGGESCQVFVN